MLIISSKLEMMGSEFWAEKGRARGDWVTRVESIQVPGLAGDLPVGGTRGKWARVSQAEGGSAMRTFFFQAEE